MIKLRNSVELALFLSILKVLIFKFLHLLIYMCNVFFILSQLLLILITTVVVQVLHRIMVL